MFDPNDPTLGERLQRKNVAGHYEISEVDLVITIRELLAKHEQSMTRRLCEALLERCLPEFQRYTEQLRHLPELREKAISNIGERFLREVMNPYDLALTQNFPHYVRCLCTDELTRISHQEGLVFMDSDVEKQTTSTKARTLNRRIRSSMPHYSLNILTHLTELPDLKLAVLRDFENVRWNDLVILYQCPKRVLRHRYKQAQKQLDVQIVKEQQLSELVAVSSGVQGKLHSMTPTNERRFSRQNDKPQSLRTNRQVVEESADDAFPLPPPTPAKEWNIAPPIPPDDASADDQTPLLQPTTQSKTIDASEQETTHTNRISTVTDERDLSAPPLPPHISEELQQRYLCGQMPKQVRLGQTVGIEVGITKQSGPSSNIALRPLLLPLSGKNIKLVLQCPPSFRAVSDTVLYMHVPLNEDSDWMLFEVQALEEGVHVLRISAYNDGTRLGILPLEISVYSTVASVSSSSFRVPLQLREAYNGEATLWVAYDSTSKTYRYRFVSKAFTSREIASEPLQRSPEDALLNFVAQLNSQARNEARRSPFIAQAWLRTTGKDLWRELIPGDLQEIFWRYQDTIKKMTIMSSGDTMAMAMPWEIMYPTWEQYGDGAGFLAEQFPLVRWRDNSMGAITQLRLSEAHYVFSSGKNAPRRAREEINHLKRTVGEGVEVKKLEQLLKILESANFGLLHFACHNTFLDANPAWSYIPLGKDHFELTLLGDYVGRFRDKAPLVFVNACRSDGVAPQYTRLAGWATRFLNAGAGAFIGTLWDVRDTSACAFAKQFYETLNTVPNATLGDAMAAARAAIKDEAGDPTWLAYTLYGDSSAFIVK